MNSRRSWPATGGDSTARIWPLIRKSGDASGLQVYVRGPLLHREPDQLVEIHRKGPRATMK